MNSLPLEAGALAAGGQVALRASAAGAKALSWLQGVLSGEGARFAQVLSSLPQIVAIPAASWLRDSPALALSGRSHWPYVAGWK